MEVKLARPGMKHHRDAELAADLFRLRATRGERDCRYECRYEQRRAREVRGPHGAAGSTCTASGLFVVGLAARLYPQSMSRLSHSCAAGLLVALAACNGNDSTAPAGDASSDTAPVGEDATAPGDGAAPEDGAASDASDAHDADGSAPQQRGCPSGATGCYTVYAHTDHVLFYFDLAATKLVEIGLFNAPQVPVGGSGTAEDTLTDLAVTPDDRVWLISNVNLYTADVATGHVTLLGPTTRCGLGNFALASDLSGNLYVGDTQGAICRVSPANPATMTPIGMMGGGFALAGDFAFVSDGTTYATAHQPSMPLTATNNALISFAPATPNTVQSIGPTGFPGLFGVAYAGGKILAFSHDGTGNVIVIDRTSGAGTQLTSAIDPTTNAPAVFAGAGINPLVSKTGP